MLIYESNRVNPSGGIYHQHNTNLEFYRHLHNSFEMIYVFEGTFRCEINGTEHTVDAGHAVLIFPNQIHYAESQWTDNRTYLCIFENDLVNEFYRLIRDTAAEHPVFPIPDPDIISRISGFDGSRYLLKSYLYEIIDLFSRSCSSYLPSRTVGSQQIEAILGFIAEHYAEDIRMQDIAAKIGYDYHYLSTLLQKNLNTTFRTVLNEYRISHAKHLLTATDIEISRISYECGYNSLCSFNRNFKELTQTTPSAYRAMKRNR
ncbi:MAG: helix-turn-helix transcriptional regulator [Clostridia bacterium]|nr:helix-turn-helix transcriptional regulator [Clostridia bacterium]